MSTTPRTYVLKTLGCKANLYDSQLIEAELQKRGWVPARGEEEAELCVVNSCTVTDEADKQSRRFAKQAVKQSAGVKVVMTGCGAEVDPELMAKSENIHFVVGNQDKNRLVDLVLGAIAEPTKNVSSDGVARGIVLGGVTNYEKILSRHPMDREWNQPEATFMLPPKHLQGDAGRTRSFIKIQEGCNSFCTYCIIPYGRGPNRSLEIPKVVAQVRELHAQGAQEIIITGTNIGDFGADWNEGTPAFETLIESILHETEIPRLRVSSLDPVEITPRLRALMRENPRFMPHFHVSLQSPHSKVLKLMKRKYAAEEVEECLNGIAELPAPPGGVYVGMDVITGFPGETLEAFEWGRAQLEKLPWTRLHVFPYSEREGTPATRLPDSVPPSERTRRARILREMSLERMKRIHGDVLAEAKKTNRGVDRVLFESVTTGPDASKHWVGGYSSNYLRVLVPFESESEAQAARNRVLPVTLESLLVDPNQGDVAFLGRLS